MYLVITKILEQTGTTISAAEAHGLATGMLCVNNLTTTNNWLLEVFSSELDLSASERLPLITLFEKTQELLNAGNFEFELFLPDEETELPLRVDALQHWCLGFLAGVGTINQGTDCSKEGLEILRDMVAFTRVDTNAKGEEDEVALVELNAYIRISVQVLREELLAVASSDTLH